MGRSCSVCALSTAGTIEVLGDSRPASQLAAEYGLEARSVQRQAKGHLGWLRSNGGPTIVGAPVSGAADTVRDPLVELVHALRIRALAGDPNLAREYRLDMTLQQDRQNAATTPRGP